MDTSTTLKEQIQALLQALLLLVLHPWFMRFISEARGYAFVMLGSTALVGLLGRALQSGQWRWWLGFGFVEFENDEDNQKAVDQLDGKELDGRTINVSLARPREERPQHREFSGNRDGNGGGSFRQRSW